MEKKGGVLRYKVLKLRFCFLDFFKVYVRTEEFINKLGLWIYCHRQILLASRQAPPWMVLICVLEEEGGFEEVRSNHAIVRLIFRQVSIIPDKLFFTISLFFIFFHSGFFVNCYQIWPFWTYFSASLSHSRLVCIFQEFF